MSGSVVQPKAILGVLLARWPYVRPMSVDFRTHMSMKEFSRETKPVMLLCAHERVDSTKIVLVTWSTTGVCRQRTRLSVTRAIVTLVSLSNSRGPKTHKNDSPSVRTPCPWGTAKPGTFSSDPAAFAPPKMSRHHQYFACRQHCAGRQNRRRRTRGTRRTRAVYH